ncbi:hypothetical protein CLHUN_07700 [Ruminiclostridium hungatei]|uniref:Anti-sigma-W factor RsiW n=1 Tax=Ruminiclostridium hungatei TaxID=48256 RepID=A0A1V4SNH1_RUMHU|nr:zf-HC2 domain-containing protein [Ruminiclostridium hungatei]OPX45400.1 hypothetical protein CLHUN_07700 [Ruminiclostridium hungatei]
MEEALNLNTDNENSCGKMDKALLQDYLEGIVDPLLKLFIEEHLSICKTCRRELSELKLMFWELGNKNNYALEYPEELEGMAEGLIDKALGREQTSPARQIINMQLNNIKMSRKFMEYLPGAKQTPEMLKKASKDLAKGVGKGVRKGVKRMLAAK